MYNITVEARNSEMAAGEWVAVNLTFEAVGKVRGLVIDDYKNITAKEEPKTFEFR